MNSPAVPIENIDALIAVVGQWNLYDMEIRGFRFNADAFGDSVLEADLYLHADNLRPRPAGVSATEYEFVLRFSGVQNLTAADFGSRNFVGDHEFAAAMSAVGDQPMIRVSITGVGGGDLLLTCSAVAVASVRELPVHVVV